MSQGRVVEGGIVSLHSGLPDWVTGACVSLLRWVIRFSQDVQGLNAGPVYHIGLLALASQRAGALSYLFLVVEFSDKRMELDCPNCGKGRGADHPSKPV